MLKKALLHPPFPKRAKTRPFRALFSRRSEAQRIAMEKEPVAGSGRAGEICTFRLIASCGRAGKPF
jgi:hypothetical protein